jgi:hypothetical protein
MTSYWVSQLVFLLLAAVVPGSRAAFLPRSASRCVCLVSLVDVVTGGAMCGVDLFLP